MMNGSHSWSRQLYMVEALGEVQIAHDADAVLTDYSQVDIPGLRYKFVNFRSKKSLGPPDWRDEIYGENLTGLGSQFIEDLGEEIRQHENDL